MIQTACLFVLLVTLQFFSGWAIIHLLKIDHKPIIKTCLSLLLGMFICALVPLLMEMVFIKINLSNFLISFFAFCLALSFNGKANLKELKEVFKQDVFSIKLYELIFIVPIALILFISAWRCFYTPPTPRDVIVGAELLAKYAVKEGSIISSVFTDNIRLSSNNPFKPPYVLNLQIAYKLIGFEFGKIWLVQNVIVFIVMLYAILKEKLHAIIAGPLLLFFIAIPDMYAYTFIILYDYSNAIYFSIAIYFLQRYFEGRKSNDLMLSSLLMSAACFIRSETLYFAAIGVFLLFVFEYRKAPIIALQNWLLYLLLPIFSYVIWFVLFMKFYMPISYDISEQINTNLFDVTNILTIISNINSNLIWGDLAHSHYAYFIEIFALSTIANLILYRNAKGWQYLAWIIIIYLGYILLSHLLPLIEIDSTVKRGFFKMFPLMLIYFSYNQIFLKFSEYIHNWESSSINK